MAEEITVVFDDEKVRVEKIKSFGIKSADGFWYDQDEREIAAVTKGRAVLEFENGGTIELKEGGFCLLEPHEKHRVAFTSTDCEWLCIFFKN